MPRAVIQFVGKNGSLYGGPLQIETSWVPRVGEMVVAEGLLPDSDHGDSTFLVQSVIYKMLEDGLIPHVTARRWFKGLREDVLKERGWLPRDGSEKIVHDEDDPALSLTV